MAKNKEQNLFFKERVEFYHQGMVTSMISASLIYIFIAIALSAGNDKVSIVYEGVFLVLFNFIRVLATKRQQAIDFETEFNSFGNKLWFYTGPGIAGGLLGVFLIKILMVNEAFYTVTAFFLMAGMFSGAGLLYSSFPLIGLSYTLSCTTIVTGYLVAQGAAPNWPYIFAINFFNLVLLGLMKKNFDLILENLIYAKNVSKLNDELGLKNEELEESRERMAINSKLAAIGEMSAGVAHEINNPLTIMLLNLRRIEKKINEMENDQISLRIRSSLKSGERIKKIVADLSMYQDMRRAVSKRPFSISTMIEKIIQGHVEQHPYIQFENEDHQDIYTLGSDSEMTQALDGIISNAIDSVSIIDPQKRYAKVSIESNNENVVILVQDNGPGVDQDITNKIFDPFFTTKEVGNGTGLGLSVSKGVVEKHGGTIELISPKAPTLFKITLKVHVPQNANKDVFSEKDLRIFSTRSSYSVQRRS